MEIQPLNTPPATDQSALIQKKLTLQAALRNGVNWFFWIAGLSIINSVIFLVGGSLTFVVGLGFTQFIDGVATGVARTVGGNAGIIVHLVGFFIDIFIAGIFIAAGVLGRKRYRWAVITGMVLYILDGILFAWFGLWLAVAFHAFALFGLWRGLQAIQNLKVFEQTLPIPPAVLDFSGTPKSN